MTLIFNSLIRMNATTSNTVTSSIDYCHDGGSYFYLWIIKMFSITVFKILAPGTLTHKPSVFLLK